MTNKRELGLIGLLIAVTVLASVAGCGERQSTDQPADDFSAIGGGVGNEAGEYAQSVGRPVTAIDRACISSCRRGTLR